MAPLASKRSGVARPRQPVVVDALGDLRTNVQRWRAAGERIALVPTMGALHHGHLTLIERAAGGCERIVVSIFVNPTQFAPEEDFVSYPRDLQTDLAAIGNVDVDAIWHPSVAAMYPDGFATSITPSGPARVGLEDAFRPAHFGGVATVVTKLFNQVQPDVAFFGEKDIQQLAVIRCVTADLDLPVGIVGVETVREPDGLALSSRNIHLSRGERAAAPLLYKTLQDCVRRIAAGEPIEPTMQGGRSTIESAGFKLDYLEARDAMTLNRVDPAFAGGLRILVAARIGGTRLIDNVGLDARTTSASNNTRATGVPPTV